MAIEKLTLVNIVGEKKDINTFAKDIYLFNDVEIIDALTEIEEGRFVIPVTEENVTGILGLKNIVSGKKSKNQKKYETIIQELQKLYSNSLAEDFNLILDKDLNPELTLKNSQDFIKQINDKSTELNFNQKQLEETEKSLEYYSYLSNIDLPMRDLIDLSNFTFKLGSLTVDNANRLKLVYSNIPSLLFHVGDTQKSEAVYLVISATDFQSETDRVLKALDFKEIEGFNSAYQSEPEQIVKMLNEKKKALENETSKLRTALDQVLNKERSSAELYYNELSMLILIEAIKNDLAFSEESFYFSGWVPTSKLSEFKSCLKAQDLLIQFQEPSSDIKIPTKLKNNWLFRPFEQLVEMYGIPNYKELDPTPFFSLTYILCFGYMFGDVGQGLVLLLAGWYVEKKGFKLGGVASRVAIASIIFGFLYGSVFGLENIIPALWIRPMEDTTTILLAAVVVGVFMLIISYIYSLINKQREHEEEEEYFGKNGISGFAIYLLVLALALMLYHILPTNELLEEVMAGIIILLTLCVFLALPLFNLIKHRRFSYNIQGEYYVSSFFEVFEMYLSMLSNTLSFIRIGAFALTHVGMFMAFQTIAEMVDGGVLGVAILIFGNIFILILEGLIDFIQCLRLEFYELFGKYYEGNGIKFITIEEKLKSLNN